MQSIVSHLILAPTERVSETGSEGIGLVGAPRISESPDCEPAFFDEGFLGKIHGIVWTDGRLRIQVSEESRFQCHD